MWQQGVSLAGYALLTHLYASTHRLSWALAALMLLTLAMLYPNLHARRASAWLTIIAIAAALLSSWFRQHAVLILFVPPIVANLALGWLFGHTLRAGSVPLVERLVRLLHPENDIQDDAVWPYARRVTLLWALLFHANALACLLLALLAVPGGVLTSVGLTPALQLPIHWWSWYANLGCYAVAALLFLSEYSYRRYRFPWQPYRNLFHFCQRAVAVGPALLASLRAPK